MKYQTFKIFDKQNEYHLYIVSFIDDLDLNLDVFQSYCEEFKDLSVSKFFNIVCNWDDIDIINCPEIPPMQVVNNIIMTNNTKCINVSDEYKQVLEQYIEQLNQKRSRKKNTEPKPKKEPKPKPKKGVVINGSDTVKFE